MKRPRKISLMFEVSEGCNQKCFFCYNSWRSPEAPRKKQLTPKQTAYLLEKVIDETGCSQVSLSGGEPMLRKDIYDLITLLKKHDVKVVLISNGLLLTQPAIDKCLSCGVDAFQITLLGDSPSSHNRLTGAKSFEIVIETILNIRKRDGTVYTFFVGLSDNIRHFKEVLELNVLLGVRNVAFGRFTPGGSGLKGWEQMIPDPAAVEHALQTANEHARKYPISVTVSTPVLPCLNTVSKYKNVRFCYCGAAREGHSIFGIDPEGNLKMCSHSPYTLGSLREKSFDELIQHPFLEDLQRALPPFCRDCSDAVTCRGGCPSSAYVCYGSLNDEDPYLKLNKSLAKKPALPSFDDSNDISVSTF